MTTTASYTQLKALLRQLDDRLFDAWGREADLVIDITEYEQLRPILRADECQSDTFELDNLFFEACNHDGQIPLEYHEYRAIREIVLAHLDALGEEPAEVEVHVPEYADEYFGGECAGRCGTEVTELPPGIDLRQEKALNEIFEVFKALLEGTTAHLSEEEQALALAEFEQGFYEGIADSLRELEDHQ